MKKTRLCRRLVLAYWVLAFTALLPRAAFAYIDPATTTYLIQIVAAVVISAGVGISVLVYKLRAGATNIRMGFLALQIKLSGKKAEGETPGAAGARGAGAEKAPPVRETFPAIVRPGDLEKMKEKMPAFLRETATPRPATGEAQPAAAAEGKWRALWRDDRPYWKRLLFCALVFASIAFTFIIFGVVDLTQANASMLPFRFSDIQREILLVALAVFAAPTIVLPVLRGRVYDFFLCLALGLLVAGYVQGNYLNSGLGTMTGDAIAWEELMPKTLVNLGIWGGILLFFFVLHYFTPKGWRAAGAVLSAAVIGIQLVALSTIQSSGALNAAAADPAQEVEGVLTTEGLYEVSSGSNIIVIILDRLDDEYLEEIEAGDEAFFAPLDGFTRYTNFVTHYPATMPSIPEFLTGKYCYFDIDQTTWLNEAWGESTFLPELKSHGYTVKLYSEKGSVYDEIQQVMGIADNTSVERLALDTREAAKKMLGLSAYRFAPDALKPSFWSPANDFGRLVYAEGDGSEPYVIDDVHYYEGLTEQGLKVAGDGGHFTFLHMQGSHDPLNYDESLQHVASPSIIQQTRGAFTIVYDYLDQLRGLGLYESSTIIIMGDHGWPNNSAQPEVEQPTLAGLLIKPAGAPSAPLAVSNVPLASENLRATIVQVAGGDPAPYGVPVAEVPESDQTPRKYFWKWPSPEGNGENHLLMYDVIGDGTDIANWHYTGSIENIPYNY